MSDFNQFVTHVKMCCTLCCHKRKSFSRDNMKIDNCHATLSKCPTYSEQHPTTLSGGLLIYSPTFAPFCNHYIIAPTTNSTWTDKKARENTATFFSLGKDFINLLYSRNYSVLLLPQPLSPVEACGSACTHTSTQLAHSVPY